MTEGFLLIHTEEVEYSYPDITHLNNWVESCIKSEGKLPGNINIIFCSDDYLLGINQEYLDHDYYTDIITFPLEEDPLEGDLYISLDRVLENADKRQIVLKDEIDRVIIHGVLHLLGYNDKSVSDKVQMTKKEDHYLCMRSNA